MEEATPSAVLAFGATSHDAATLSYDVLIKRLLRSPDDPITRRSFESPNMQGTAKVHEPAAFRTLQIIISAGWTLPSRLDVRVADSKRAKHQLSALLGFYRHLSDCAPSLILDIQGCAHFSLVGDLIQTAGSRGAASIAVTSTKSLPSNPPPPPCRETWTKTTSLELTGPILANLSSPFGGGDWRYWTKSVLQQPHLQHLKLAHSNSVGANWYIWRVAQLPSLETLDLELPIHLYPLTVWCLSACTRLRTLHIGVASCLTSVPSNIFRQMWPSLTVISAPAHFIVALYDETNIGPLRSMTILARPRICPWTEHHMHDLLFLLANHGSVSRLCIGVGLPIDLDRPAMGLQRLARILNRISPHQRSWPTVRSLCIEQLVRPMSAQDTVSIATWCHSCADRAHKAAWRNLPTHFDDRCVHES
jgi:hypothetical protein